MKTIVMAVLMLCGGCGIECSFWNLDQDVAECISKYGAGTVVTCFSDGKPVFTDRSAGEVMYSPGSALFLSATTGRHARVTGACTFTPAGDQ
jgi:hypothetical protein